ncbi:4-phosphoerythronate dehydrogenase [Piscirickettsia litoralis]|uniref:Hydroxyacid dehydrogenase n=1 Tax=Piscirickettsia litoralis TaxID=1891921 RepID=A0ABX2ZYY6_9GAMM|nr:4-phosphoerythronate dehydrogenase [Piscirickettsia litoralis]ODN41836.1 hydroxyacid dehydrogenase [Piscirickettsia litoralis]
MISILADDAIPYLDGIFPDTQQARLIKRPGREIHPGDLKGIDALLLRTVTQVNHGLLARSSVRYIATASAGFDHFNLADLKDLDIDWYAAQGCNARAVAEYVISNIALLQLHDKLPIHDAKVGIIGVGHVGSQVAQLLKIIGLTPVCYDPPRQLRDASFKSASLADIGQCQMLSCHLPLVRQGDDSTINFIDKLLDKLADNSIILNAGRGESLSLSAISRHPQHRYLLDVWDAEPNIDANYLDLKQIELITPHIAGYGVMGKYNATCMATRWLADKLGVSYQPVSLPEAAILNVNEAKTWQEVVLAAYDPRIDDAEVRKLLDGRVEPLRRNYLLRAPFSRRVKSNNRLKKNDKNILSKLDFNFFG